MSADRSNELIDLLEMIVLQSGSELSENKNLRAHPDRHHKAIDYINRLNNYDTYMHVTCRTSPITVGSELYEKALVIYASCVEHQEFRLAQICAL